MMSLCPTFIGQIGSQSRSTHFLLWWLPQGSDTKISLPWVVETPILYPCRTRWVARELPRVGLTNGSTHRECYHAKVFLDSLELLQLWMGA